MHLRKSITTAFILCLLITANTCFAGDTTGKKFPKFILAQLNTESNRINALTRDNRAALLAIVKQDAAGERAAMMKDFKDHFDYCPVYYYDDTNAERIKAKQFDGILLNADGSILQSLSVTSATAGYYIVCYGTPVKQTSAHAVTDSEAHMYNGMASEPRGLVVYNEKMQQVGKFAKFAYGDVFTNKTKMAYSYKSKKFDIEYFPFAKAFNNALRNDPHEL